MIKKQFLKIPVAFALTATILSAAPSASFAVEGGWTEGEGNWISADSNVATFAATDTASKPQKHYASFNYRDYSTYVGKQVVAHTTWKGVRHYSRARFVGIFGVEADSQRVYGTGTTKAASLGFVDPAGTVAKTYWGK